MISSDRLQAFHASIDKKEAGCWLWKGAKFTSGYGSFWDGKKYLRAHRFAYKLFNGEFPGHLEVMHTCDVRDCVNPHHLILGTHHDNMLQMKDKGRAPSGSKNGLSKLTVEEVWQIRELYASRKYTAAELAELYGVGVKAVRKYLNFTRYATEPNPYERKGNV